MQNNRQKYISVYLKLHILNSNLKAKYSAVGKLSIILNDVTVFTVQLYVSKKVSR